LAKFEKFNCSERISSVVVLFIFGVVAVSGLVGELKWKEKKN